MAHRCRLSDGLMGGSCWGIAWVGGAFKETARSSIIPAIIGGCPNRATTGVAYVGQPRGCPHENDPAHRAAFCRGRPLACPRPPCVPQWWGDRRGRPYKNDPACCAFCRGRPLCLPQAPVPALGPCARPDWGATTGGCPNRATTGGCPYKKRSRPSWPLLRVPVLGGSATGRAGEWAPSHRQDPIRSAPGPGAILQGGAGRWIPPGRTFESIQLHPG